jgi:SAM-dependent methyltransferase
LTLPTPPDPEGGGLEARFAAERERYDQHYGERWAGQDLALPERHQERPNDLRRATLYALDRLGDLHGLDVLELGAGSGVDSVMLARLGATVTSTDIAEASVELIERRFTANAITGAHAAVMPAEALSLPDASFDRIFARGVLHHADVAKAAPEMARVLRPGGRAVFIEPLSENPVLDFAREHVPYPHKTRPKGHRGIRYATIRTLGESFSSTSIKPMYLTSMLNRAFGFGVELHALQDFDDWLLGRVPTFGRLCRYVVVTCAR